MIMHLKCFKINHDIKQGVFRMIHTLFLFYNIKKEKTIMTIEEKKELCTKAFINWFLQERDNHDFKNHDKEIADLFTSQVLLKKFDVFDIDIVLPDMLLMILHICTNNNPGQVQIILKDLLNDIKKRKGSIKPGYVITTNDFSLYFIRDFPIVEVPEINAKYESLWMGQKIENNDSFGSDNLCDTIEWWKEVMEC